MDVNFGLFSERLRRLLAGEEVTLPDPALQLLQNLQADVEILASLLRDYQYDLSWLLLHIIAEKSKVNFPEIDVGEDQIDSSDLEAIVEEINCFTREFDSVIDTFIITINHRSCSNDILEALLPLQSKIIDITKQLQQVKHLPANVIDKLKSLFQAGAGNSPTSSSVKKRDTVGLDDRMEELLDLLIEGPPQLSTVAILDSVEVDKTAFTEEAYNSNYVKHYFDCHAWVGMPFLEDPHEILDVIMKSVVPLAQLRQVMDKNHETKQKILHDYLMNKRYLFVIDAAMSNDVQLWDQIREILPDNRNGSRVLVLVSDADILTSFQLENGQSIQLDFVPAGGPLKVTYEGWPLLILYHGSMSLEENEAKTIGGPFVPNLIKVQMLPLYLKLCCLYLSPFPPDLEIPTRQLYQLWIAEGFIPDNRETTAEEYLEELFDRGFIQVRKRRPDGTIKTCCNATLPWIAVSSTSFVVEFSHPQFSDKIGKPRHPIKRYATIFFLSQVLNFLNELDSCLHSLLYLSSKSYDPGPVDWEDAWKIFKLLRVLDLGSLVLNQYPSGIENLFLLRYLKLNIPSLKSLPSSLLCNLLNLYTLDMPSSYIDHTADDFWKMNKLRHLNFGSIKLPGHPGKYCTSLENLNFISALHPSCCTPDIMSRLPNLQNLKIHGDLNYHQSILSKSLCSLSCLESLKLVNESKMPKHSKITLAEYHLPPGLTKLSFSNLELLDDPMPTLEKLPHLQVLKLKKNTYLGRKLACGSDGFPMLKTLHLKSMLWLEEWTMEIGAMPKLECLIINPCAYLKRLPEQLLCKKSFKKLELGWPQPELRQALRVFEDKKQYDIQLYPYGI